MKPETDLFLANEPLILASRSPRRIALLREIGLPFEAIPSRVEERLEQGQSPELLALGAARSKAEEVADRFPRRFVLGADTVVYLDDRVLGKPQNRAEARAMLCALRNRWHCVVTALCLIVPGDLALTAAETTRVRMADFSDEDLERYLATDEPLDKAGAYGIQGTAARLVEAIDGDYFNVVGLPIEALLRLLNRWIAVDKLTLPPVPDRFAPKLHGY